MNRIAHRDLHLGNVVISAPNGQKHRGKEKAYVIDWSRTRSYDTEYNVMMKGEDTDGESARLIQKWRGFDATCFNRVVTTLLSANDVSSVNSFDVKNNLENTKYSGLNIGEVCLDNPRGMRAFELIFLLTDVTCFKIRKIENKPESPEWIPDSDYDYRSHLQTGKMKIQGEHDGLPFVYRAECSDGVPRLLIKHDL